MKHTLPLAEYGLASARVTRLDGHGAINEVYKVESAAGVFVLKEYSGIPMDAERLGQLCAVQAIVRDAGLPVPAVIPTRDGRIFSSSQGRFFLMTDYVVGHTYPGGDMPDGVAYRVGAAHAKLLDALAGIPGALAQELPALASTESRLRTLLDIGNKRRERDALDEAACRQLEQKLRMLQAWQAPEPVLEAHWTHGDITWRNLLFDEDDEIAAIVDFDNFRVADRARDVMRCFTLSFPHGSSAALSYFAGYASSSGITPEEARRYVHLYHYMSIYGVWPIDVRYMQPESYQERWGEFLQPRSLEWETGWDELADRLADIAARVHH